MKGIVTREQLIDFYAELLAAPSAAARDAIVDLAAGQLPESGTSGPGGGGASPPDEQYVHEEGHAHTRPDGSRYSHAHRHLHEAAGEHGEATHDTPDHDAAHEALNLPPVHVRYSPENRPIGGGTGADAGQLSNSGYSRSGSVYDMAPGTMDALADIGEALETQMQDHAAIAREDAADAARARGPRPARMSAEERAAHQIDRIERGTFTAEPSSEDLDQVMISAAHAEAADMQPDDMAAVITEAPGAMRSIAEQFYAESGGDGMPVQIFGDPDADVREDAYEDLMPAVGGLSARLKGMW